MSLTERAKAAYADAVAARRAEEAERREAFERQAATDRLTAATIATVFIRDQFGVINVEIDPNDVENGTLEPWHVQVAVDDIVLEISVPSFDADGPKPTARIVMDDGTPTGARFQYLSELGGALGQIEDVRRYNDDAPSYLRPGAEPRSYPTSVEQETVLVAAPPH